jgi:energy-converting hydrogenase Eha subunit B
MALLLRRWGHRWPGAVIGGVAFMLGGFFVSLGNFVNNLQTVAWVPWLFLSWDRVMDEERIRDLLWFAVLCGVAFLGGEPQMLALALLLVFVHGLVRVEGRRLGGGRQTAAFTIAGVLALLLVSVQLLPFAEYMSHSVRTLPIELDYASSRSLDLAGAWHFLLPPALRAGAYDFSTRYMASTEVPWILSVYPGAIVLVLATIGVFRGRGLRWTAFWVGVAATGVLLALGSHSPLYRSLFDWVPPFRAFRYPEKFLLPAALAVSVLAAQGADRWIDRGAEASQRMTRHGASRWANAAIWGPLLSIGALYASFAVWLYTVDGGLASACRQWLDGAMLCREPQQAGRLYGGIAARIAVLAVCLAVLTGLYRSGRLRHAVASTLLVALVTVDLGMAHREVNPSVAADIYVTPPWTARALDEPMTPRGDVRYRGSPHRAAMGSVVQVRGAWELSNMYLDYQTMGPNVGQIYGFPMQDGLQGVELVSVALTHEAAMRAWSEDPLRFLRAMNVGYYADATAGADSMAGLTPVASHPELPIRLFAVPDPAPRLYLVPAVEQRNGPAEALRRVLEDDFPLGRRAVLEVAAESLPLDPRATGEVLERTDRINGVSARVRATGPMLAVLSDRWYPGWKVTVDGAEARLLRANGVFRAVVVPSGESAVEFRFVPGSVRLGAAFSVFGLLVLASAWAVSGGRAT